jgi:hypothetical protein
MLNVMAWILFGSPLIITAILMVRGARRDEARRLLEGQRMAAFAPGPYFSNTQGSNRRMISL